MTRSRYTRGAVTCMKMERAPAAAAAALVMMMVVAAVAVSAQSPSVHLLGRQLIVDHQPFEIRGVCYSPTPIGMWSSDLFTEKWAPLWERDLPLISAMGANTIRVYDWDAGADHSAFLDAVHRHHLRVILSFPVQGEALGSAGGREGILSAFASQVAKYPHHPGLLGWAIGNELNGAWVGSMQALSDSYACGWHGDVWPAGCSNYEEQQHGSTEGKSTGPDCAAAVPCVYKALFSFLNDAATRAHAAGAPLVIAPLADVDHLPRRLSAYEEAASAVDVWGAQLYRGATFGGFLDEFASASSKPLAVLEFGSDAYRDPCGRSDEQPCTNTVDHAPLGYGEDEAAQADYDVGLARELASASTLRGGSVLGGCVMEYLDEYWKNKGANVKGCDSAGSKQCAWKSHVGCPSGSMFDLNLCGYFLPAAFDMYANEAWWGIMAPVRNTSAPAGTISIDAIDHVRPRQAYFRLQVLWTAPDVADSYTHPLTLGRVSDRVFHPPLMVLFLLTLLLAAVAGAIYLIRRHQQQSPVFPWTTAAPTEETPLVH